MIDVLLILSFIFCSIAAIVFSCLDMNDIEKQIRDGKRKK
jgi:hypothetical protein